MKTEVSKKLHERASRSMPGGVSGTIKYGEPFPISMKRAEGSRFWDVDGNEYIDYLMSYGALVLGHGSPIVKDAVRRALEEIGTTSFGVSSESEVKLAELVLSVFKRNGMLRFTNSGLEATLLAVRVARAKTGRRKIAKFEGHYHGANPFLLVNYKPKRPREGQLPVERQADSGDVFGSLLEDSVALPFNDESGVVAALGKSADEIAAIVVEPFEDGYIPAEPGFLQFLSKVAKDHGALLVYDEVKTGFRVRLGGATEFYGVKPDLTCLGKILGGGFPAGAVVGDPDSMELLNPASKDTRRVFHSGTFNGNPVAMESGYATISALKEGGLDRLRKIGESLRQVISQALTAEGVAHRMYGEGGVANYILGEKIVKSLGDLDRTDLGLRKAVDSAMIDNGIYSARASRFSPSLAHTPEDIQETGRRLQVSLKQVLERPEVA